MICKVCQTIDRYSMIPKGSTVTVALSGGADSMSLLAVLKDLQNQYSFSLQAVHINHGIRGEEADRDEHFVIEQCRKANIPLLVEHFDVPAVAKQTGEGIEECGRRLRYSFFDTIQTDYIATAHNLNDRIETFLFRFARGTGIHGLCSIPAVRGKYIRPLINISREEIEEFCKANRVPYVTDSTNADITYARNRIRALVVPALKQINPALEFSAERCMESLIIDDDYLTQQSRKLVSDAKIKGGFDVEKLYGTHSAIRSRALGMIIVKKTGITADSKEINSAENLLSKGGLLQLKGKYFLRVRNGILDFPAFTAKEEWEYPLQFDCTVLPRYTVSAQIINIQDKNKLQLGKKTDFQYSLDYDKINGVISFRNRRAGDSVCFAGRNCTKTLKKLFNESKIPPENRDNLVIGCDENGLLFVQGFGVCQRCAVTKQTEKILQLSFRRT